MENATQVGVPKRQDIQQLRGVAVLAVVVNHIEFNWLPVGYLGVDIFFVLSGFVITNSVLQWENSATSRSQFFARFWVRRIYRLWPMLFFSTLLSTVLLHVSNSTRSGTLVTGLSSLLGLSNFRLLFGRLDYFELDTNSDWFMHTWSLAVEEQVYLVLSLIFFCFGVSRIRNSSKVLSPIALVLAVSVIFSIAISFFSFTAEIVRFYMPHARLYQIFSGVLICLTVSRFPRLPETSPAGQLILLFSGLGVAILLLFDFGSDRLASLGMTVFIGVMLVSSSRRQHEVGFLSLSWLSKIGDRSYAIYLLHWPILRFVDTLSLNSNSKLLLSVLLIFGFGSLCHTIVDDRCRLLWRRMSFKRAYGVAVSSLVLTFSICSGVYAWSNSNAASEQRLSGLESTCTREHSQNWLIGDSHLGAILAEVAASLDGDCKVIDGLGFNVLFESSLSGNVDQLGRRERWVRVRETQGLINLIRAQKPRLVLITHFLTGLMADPKTAPMSANWVTTEWRDHDGSSVSRAEFLDLFGKEVSELSEVIAQIGGFLILTSPPPDFNWLAEPNDSYSDLNYELLCSSTYPSTTHSRIVPQCEIWRGEARITRDLHALRISEIQKILNEIQIHESNFFHFALDELFCSKRVCSNFRDGAPVFLDDDHVNERGSRIIGVRFREILHEFLVN